MDTRQLENLLSADGAQRDKAAEALARLAVRPGAEIDEALVLKALAEAGISPDTAKGNAATLRAVSDEDLDSVAGGRILFNDDGVNRNSWFVSLLSMLIAQDGSRPDAAAAQGPLPRQITIDGKTYRVLRVGVPGSYKYVLEELK